MSKFSISHLLQFFIFVAVQILFLRNLALFDTGFAFIYVAFLLFLPIEVPPVLLLFIGFTTGITVDVFYDTAGVHAGASVLLCFLRPHILKLLTPRDGYDSSDEVNLHVMGWKWFMTYTVMLVLAHHFALFFLEAAGLHKFWFTLAKVLVSTFFTTIVLFIIQLLFFSARRVAR